MDTATSCLVLTFVAGEGPSVSCCFVVVSANSTTLLGAAKSPAPPGFVLRSLVRLVLWTKAVMCFLGCDVMGRWKAHQIPLQSGSSIISVVEDHGF